MALNARQRIFVAQYLKHKNATKAAKEAGYSEDSAHVIGPRLLENVSVKEELAKGVQSITESLGIGPEYILGSLRQVADRCMQGEKVMEFDPVSKEMVETGEWKFEHNGANKALELLGKYQKLFTDKLEIDDKSGIADKLKKFKGK
jgi:phage terminase small subunit